MAIPNALNVFILTTIVPILIIDCMDRQGEPRPAVRDDNANIALSYEAERRKLERDMTQAMNPAVGPCDDFVQYACGGWARTHRRSSESFRSWRVNDIIALEIRDRVTNLMRHPPSGRERKGLEWARSFYESCIAGGSDEDKSHLLNFLTLIKLHPLSNNELGTWDYLDTLKFLRKKYGINVFFSWDIRDNGAGDVQIYFAKLVTMFGSRLNEVRNLKLRIFYSEVSNFLGLRMSAEQFNDVLDLEEMLTRMRSSDQASRQVITIDSLIESVPKIDWMRYFKDMFRSNKIKGSTTVMIANLPSIREVSQLLHNCSQTERGKRSLAHYILMRIVFVTARSIPTLSRSLEILTNNPHPDRHLLCFDLLIEYFNVPLKELFTKTYLSEDSGTQVEEIISGTRDALKRVFSSAVWMDETTKTRSREKLDHLKVFVGYNKEQPSQKLFESIAKYKATPQQSYFEKLLAAMKSRKKVEFARLTNEKLATPSPELSTINAFYLPSKNTVELFPYLIIPPMFSRAYPKSINFGGLGSTLGHEMSHAIEDGSRCEKGGVLQRACRLVGLRNRGYIHLWTPETLDSYEPEKEFLQDFFTNLSTEHLQINGKRTFSENVADLTGLKAAYLAYKDSPESRNDPLSIQVHGLNNDQLFFVKFAQSHCQTNPTSEPTYRFSESVHAPGHIRIIGTLSNTPEFASAFNCPVDSEYRPIRRSHMYPANPWRAPEP